ncbi:MAG: SGNH/GDSL hydrolase family protein [Planctomycetota bacterium]
MGNASLNDTYPVAAASGRRRRLLALRSVAEVEEETHSEGTDAENGFLPDWWHSRQDEIEDRETSEPTPLDRIRELVDDPAPRTWLFAGDSLGFGSKHAKRGWIEHFSDVIRSHLGRSLDVVLDTTTDEARCDRLLRNVDWRILRFQPDAVLLMPGPGEVSQLEFNADRLRDALAALVDRLREEGSEVVLCTLPPLRSSSDELTDRLDTLAAIVREVAISSQILLVDHAERWGGTAEAESRETRLLDKSGTRPTQHGHRKLARNLIQTLELPFK